MRLIDADVLIKTLDSYELTKWYHGDLITIIFDAPTVEAEPVRHGKWECLAENSTGNIYSCSNCTSLYNPNSKDVAMGRIVENPHYCPHCGAEMDGD